MSDYYTQTDGERPDLSNIEVNPPEGYIGLKILPAVNVVDATGTIYYATVKADATAATSRSAATAPTAVQISNSNTSFTTVEHITRGGITPAECKSMGGIEKMDMVGAKYAKRNAMNALETDLCSVILGIAASNNWDAAKFLQDSQDALQSIHLYEGRTVLIGSSMVLKRMVRQILADDSVGPMFSRMIAGTSPQVAVTGMNFQSWKNALAMYIGVDEVLAGNDTVWNATTYDGHFAIAKIDDGTDELSHKWKPVLGKTYIYLPDGKQPYVVTTAADRININNIYDCAITFDSKVLNSGACYVFDGVAA